MKRLISLTLCFFTLTGLLSGCGGDDDVYVPTGDALVMEGQDPDSVGPQEEEVSQEFSLAYYPNRSMNPLKCNDFTNRTLFSLIYQGLFSTSSDYTSIPILCSRYQVSPDNKIWTFYIENATFSDGSAVTLEDVLATYQAAMASNYYGKRFTHVSNIAINEKGGITFYLLTAYENLPILLDIPILKASQLEDDYPLGTGPYTFQTTLSGAHLQKRTDWWCTGELAVNATTIPLIEAQSPSQIRDEFEFNDVGLVCTDPGMASYADFRCDYELWDCDNGVMLFLGCNINYSDVFSDEGMRSALTYAINREQIVDDIYRGLAQSSTLAASPRSPYYSSSLADRYSYDPMKFVDALSKYVNESGVITKNITLLVNSDDSMRLRAARAIVEMLSECGLPIVTDEQSSTAFTYKLIRGEYDLYLAQTKLPPNMDLSEFFRPYGELGYNGITNNDLYTLCKDSLANQGNYYNLLKSVADDGRICPILFSGHSIYAERGLLSDLTPSRDNVFCYSLGKTMEGIQIPTEYNTN